MRTKEKRIKFDGEKLNHFLSEKGITKRELSRRMARCDTYISQLIKKVEITENEEMLICYILGVEQGTFVKLEKNENVEQGESKILQNIYREILELRAEIALTHKKEDRILEEIASLNEPIDKLLVKANANTIQLEKIKESVKVLGMSGFEKSVRFLEEILKDGKVLESEVQRRGDAEGLSQADINKAKRELGVNVVATGYGKNQKKWWVLG